MKNIWNKAAWLFLASPLLLASCDKNDTGELEGPAPTASFTTSSVTEGLITKVTFTSTSTDGFLYRWDFGDGTSGSGQTVTHNYKRSGAVKTVLTVAGRGGTAISDTMSVALPEIPLSNVKQLLTGVVSKTWTLDNTVKAPIIVGTEGNPGQYYNGADPGKLPECQSDDEYTFSAANVLTYDAKTGTQVAPAQTCQAPRSGDSEFTFGPAVGAGYAMIELKRAGAFIGVTDVPDQTYRIMDITDKTMVLRAGKPSGTVFEFKMVVK